LSLKCNQDKFSTRFPRLDIPCVVLPEKYQEYRIENYGYSASYRLQITHLDYHYSRYETRFRSLFSQRTLFWVLLSHIEWVKSFFKSFTTNRQEAPYPVLWPSRHDSALPVNWFLVLSKYVKEDFPKDQLVQTGIGIEEVIYSFRLYVEEDQRYFLCSPTYTEWIAKQNRVPTTFTEIFVE
jgi:hypothetical protein